MILLPLNNMIGVFNNLNKLIIGSLLFLLIPGYLIVRIFFVEEKKLNKALLSIIFSIMASMAIAVIIGYNREAVIILGGFTTKNLYLWELLLILLLSIASIIHDLVINRVVIKKNKVEKTALNKINKIDKINKTQKNSFLKKIFSKNRPGSGFFHSREFHTLLLSLILVLLLILIFISAIITIPGNKSYLMGFDKLIHFIEFFIFSYFLILFLSIKKSSLKIEFFIMINVLLALATETTQLFLITRTFSINDMIADLSGAFFGFLVFYIVHYIHYLILLIKKRFYRKEK